MNRRYDQVDESDIVAAVDMIEGLFPANVAQNVAKWIKNNN